jgi:putative ABC transport system permease protein
MSWIDAGRHWFRTLFERDRLAREMDDEMRFHLDLEAMDQRAGGTLDADGAARRRFGHTPSVREARRDATGLALLDRVAQDATYAWRQLWRAPAFTIAVAMTLALGVGANATMFAIVDRIMLRAPEGITDAEQLVQLRHWRQLADGGIDSSESYSYPSYMELRGLTDVFQSVTAVRGPVDVAVERGPDAVNLRMALVGDAYFETLGGRPALGRFFRPDETREPEGAAVAVISHRLWQTRYGSDPNVLGRTFLAGPTTFMIVGVAPAGFTGYSLGRTDLWMPIAGAPGLRYGDTDWYNDRGTHWLAVFARLRADVPTEQAIARISTVWTAWNMRPGTVRPPPTSFFASLVPARAASRPEYQVARLLGVVSLLLLVVTVANVANLLLARALSRRREVAIRLALGVSRARLGALFILDAALLALLGSAAAIALAWAGIPVVRSVIFAGTPTEQWGVDARVALFSLGIALVAGVLAGIVPAYQASRPALLESLRSGTREGSSYRSRTRGVLLVAQGALTIALLAGTGLFVRSLERIGEQRLGLDLHRVVVADFEHSGSGLSEADVRQLFYQFRDRARVLPGVESASLSVGVPLEGQYGLPISVAGLDSFPGMARGHAPFIYAVTPEFFTTMGTRLLAGRSFTEADDSPLAPPVGIVNEKFVRHAWPNGDAIGQCFKIVLRYPTPDCIRVVGVVENMRENVTGDEVIPQYFVPLSQAPGMLSELTLVARGADAHALGVAIGALGRSLRPDMPYVNIRTLEDAVAPELRPWRLGAAVFALFGVLALIVAAVGTYSVIQFGVSQRHHEIAVRIALGAQRRALARMVLAETLRNGAVAAVAGLVVVLAAGPLIRDHLFRTSPRDPLVLAVVIIVLLGSATLATLLPAWRATRVDPLTALKTE